MLHAGLGSCCMLPRMSQLVGDDWAACCTSHSARRRSQQPQLSGPVRQPGQQRSTLPGQACWLSDALCSSTTSSAQQAPARPALDGTRLHRRAVATPTLHCDRAQAEPRADAGQAAAAPAGVAPAAQQVGAERGGEEGAAGAPAAVAEDAPQAAVADAGPPADEPAAPQTWQDVVQAIYRCAALLLRYQAQRAACLGSHGSREWFCVRCGEVPPAQRSLALIGQDQPGIGPPPARSAPAGAGQGSMRARFVWCPARRAGGGLGAELQERAAAAALALLRHLHAWGATWSAPEAGGDAAAAAAAADPASAAQAVLQLLTRLTKRHSIALKARAAPRPPP
jgi:hypothetical protein